MSKKVVAMFTLLALIAFFGGLAQPVWASTTVTGTLVFHFTYTVKSTLAVGAALNCTAMATVNDAGSGATFSEGASSFQGSGTPPVCTVEIPYSWNLASASSDKIVLSYSIATSPAGSNLQESRTSQVQNFITISVPANGAITTENIAVTL